uniref:Uncharacterized protein n=1 Tax=Odontella aurita TaxID=265563 RepID=A0A6U6IHD6_9STRA|mmetsp:Transcript_50194/g.151096  ORF Transcript_50194/g.151096 Transcript_50194/m.151096 type:complete len:113 (+) Transcript_50194:242-580(+)
MNQFIQRVANYIANEVLIKGLANSRTFQRFAVRTDKHITEMKGKGTNTLNEAMDELHKTATETAFSSGSKVGMHTSAKSSVPTGPPQPPLRGFAGFLRAFGAEIKKDLGLGS